MKRRRKDDKGRATGMLSIAGRHASSILSLLVLGGALWGATTYYATAADVEKKFSAVKVEIKTVALEARRQRLEDELFRLRTNVKEKGAMAQIQRYESELRDVTARLRQLEERRP